MSYLRRASRRELVAVACKRYDVVMGPPFWSQMSQDMKNSNVRMVEEWVERLTPLFKRLLKRETKS
jgi:hypothetical protein